MREEEWRRIAQALGATVREVRTLLGWSQQELADQAVVSQGAISRLERGHAGIPLHTVVVVMQTLTRGVQTFGLPVSPHASALMLFVQTLTPHVTITATLDPDLLAIVHTFHGLSERQRTRFLAFVRATADLVQGMAEGPPP